MGIRFPFVRVTNESLEKHALDADEDDDDDADALALLSFPFSIIKLLVSTKLGRICVSETYFLVGHLKYHLAH